MTDDNKTLWDEIIELGYKNAYNICDDSATVRGIRIGRVGGCNSKVQSVHLIRNAMLNSQLTRQELIDLVDSLYDVERNVLRN